MSDLICYFWKVDPVTGAIGPGHCPREWNEDGTSKALPEVDDDGNLLIETDGDCDPELYELDYTTFTVSRIPESHLPKPTTEQQAWHDIGVAVARQARQLKAAEALGTKAGTVNKVRQRQLKRVTDG